MKALLFHCWPVVWHSQLLLFWYRLAIVLCLLQSHPVIPSSVTLVLLFSGQYAVANGCHIRYYLVLQWLKSEERRAVKRR